MSLCTEDTKTHVAAVFFSCLFNLSCAFDFSWTLLTCLCKFHLELKCFEQFKQVKTAFEAIPSLEDPRAPLLPSMRECSVRSDVVGSSCLFLTCLFKLVSKLVGYFGFNGPLRQYFSLYRAVPKERVGWLVWGLTAL